MKPSTYALAWATALGAAPLVQADPGHALPAGVPALGHLHLWGSLAVAPHWLAAVGIALAATVALCVRRWRRAATRDGRGGNRPSR